MTVSNLQAKQSLEGSLTREHHSMVHDPHAEAAARLDAADPLKAFRGRFQLPADVIYLDGNSLGPLPAGVVERVNQIVAGEWGTDLIGSWNKHDWIGAPVRIGGKIARLVGAKPEEVVVADSTSVNLFKLAVAAMRERTGRRVILSEPGNFPTELYMLEGVAELLGAEVRIVPRDRIVEAITDEVALVVLTHVHYKTAAKFDMRSITRAAHDQGALVLWDLSHSVGAVPLDLNGDGADLAIGCGYKYLNGGPGAPAFLFVAERHHERIRSPLSGWMGHREPFAFRDEYEPGNGVERFLCGTPPILSLLTLEAGVDIFLDVDMASLERKSRAMSEMFIARVESDCSGFELELATPKDPAARGSHVSFKHPDAWAVTQALIARAVVGDFRGPDMVRFGFTPLYSSFAEVSKAAAVLREVLASGEWKDARFSERQRVT